MADEDTIQPMLDAWDARAQYLIEAGQNWPPLPGAPLLKSQLNAPEPLAGEKTPEPPAPTSGTGANQTDTGVIQGPVVR